MLDTTNLLKVGNFDPTTIAQLADALGAGVVSTSAAGTLPITSGYSQELTIVGTMAFTLPAPTVAGQRCKVSCAAASATPLGTLTVTNPENTAGFVCSSTFIFTTPGQSVEFVASGATTPRWRAVRVNRTGVRTVVVGTTVLTGLNLENYALSITGTVSSTTTRAIPDGSSIGEVALVGCSVAATSPSGTIGLTGLTTLGAAGTTLGTYTTTAMWASVMWNGTSWQLQGQNTVVIS